MKLRPWIGGNQFVLIPSLALLGVLALACEGALGTPLGKSSGEGGGDGDGDTLGDGDVYEGGEVPDDAACVDVGTDVGSNVLRRLSRVEYQLTLQDLFALTEPPEIERIPGDIDQEGFTSFSDVQRVTAQHLGAYLDTAQEMLAALEAESARYAQVVGCAGTDADCVSSHTARFGRLAFRRTLTDEEIAALTAAAVANAADPADQIRYVTEALLVSPHFLFRIEVGDQMDGLSTLAPGELASKLSFTIWGRSPSAALLDRAESGELSTPEGLIAVVDEMLGDPRAQTYYEEFFRQWLGYATLRPPIEPPADWSDSLMAEMTGETDTLLNEYAWEPGADFFDALTANHTTVSASLASFYGITPDAAGRYEFPVGDPRENSGLLGHASILSQKTDGDKVSVRGNWLRNTFLCQELEVPPSLAETLGDALVGLTSIEIIEKRNTEQPCSGCHQHIDPIGIGLATFDSAGRFDPTVDLSVYPLTPAFPDAAEPAFSSVGELAEKVRAAPELSSCLTERVFIYGYGRHAAGEDACAFEGATATFSEANNSFSALLRGLVLSDGFRYRRAPVAPTAP